MCQIRSKISKMLAILNFLFATTLVPVIFTMRIDIPSSSGLVSPNMYQPPMTQTTPRQAFYPYNQLPQPVVQRGQPMVPHFMSDPLKFNGVNSHIFARQPLQEYNPFGMTMDHPEVQRNSFAPMQFMSDPSMQGYQHPNPMMMPTQMAMPMQIPMQMDPLRHHVAFLIQSAYARLNTYLALAEKFFPHNSPFMNNMGQSDLYPLPYVQQYHTKVESQEDLGEEILAKQQQSANEQQQVINNDHREQEYEAELENKQRLELEQQEIEREKREAEEKIKQEQDEERQKQELERKEREEQEMRLQQIEEAEKNKKKMYVGMEKSNMIPKPKMYGKVGLLQRKSSNKIQGNKLTNDKNSETKSIDEEIRSISQMKKQKLLKSETF